MSAPTIDVLDGGHVLCFGLADLMRYHGPAFPGGVAHGFTAMRRAWPLLDPSGPPARREIRLETAFPGPGARDAFELVTRMVTEDRYAVRPELERPDLGRVRARYVFRWSCRDRTVTLQIRDGFVTDEFIALGRAPNRSAAQEARLAVLKQEMADRPPDEVYDVTDS